MADVGVLDTTKHVEHCNFVQEYRSFLAFAYLWPPYVIGGPLYFCPVISIYRLSSFFSSPNLRGRRLDVYHTLTHGVALV